MIWKIKFSEKADKEFYKLDNHIKQKIFSYLNNTINKDDPRLYGKPLSNNLKGYWRYRYKDFRMICKLIDSEMIILVLKVAHRKEVYKMEI